MTERRATVTRTTRETDVRVELNLDGDGRAEINTGIGFLDHMLTALVLHGRFNCTLSCKGDLEVDDHHTAEDCAIVLGSAFDEALGDRENITRFGSAFAPLDESLARAVVDLSGRPGSVIELDLQREMLGALSSENIPHFFRSLATSMRSTIHLDVVRGENDHHKAEAAFKALALALRAAVCVVDTASTPSTKGTLR